MEYGDNYGVGSPINKELMDIFYKRTSKAGILNDNQKIFSYLNEFPQKSYQSKLI